MATVSYIDANGETQTLEEGQYTLISSDDYTSKSWGDENTSEGWYVVGCDNNRDGVIDANDAKGSANNFTINGSILLLSKSIHLILVDGFSLTVNGSNEHAGIETSTQEDASFTIYGQSSGTGSLTVTGGDRCAGIGGIYNGNGNNITINGGTVTATGGDGAAGIGGGKGGSGVNITINGGTVTATCGDGAAGIGGGSGGSGENITIHGGIVYATGTMKGIGAGENGQNSSVYVDGDIGVKTGDNMDTLSTVSHGDDTNLGEGWYLQKCVTCGVPDNRIVVDGEDYVSLNEDYTYYMGTYADGNGGGVYVNEGGKLYGDHDTFRDTKVTGTNALGGAIYNAGTVALASSTAFNGNSASGDGGAIYNAGTVNFSTVSFNGNSASGDGGAIYNNGGTVNFLDEATFEGNSATHGGAIFNIGTVEFQNNLKLRTSTDIIQNGSDDNEGTLKWMLSGATSKYQVSLVGYQYLTNHGTNGHLEIYVSATQTTGNYEIARGDFTDVTNKNTFTIKSAASDVEDITVTIGGAEPVIQGDFKYSLAVNNNNTTGKADDDYLVLTVAAVADMTRVAVNSNWTGTTAGTELTVDGKKYVYGENAFDNNASALELGGVQTLTFADGTYENTVQNNTPALNILAGTYNKKVLGGNIVSTASELEGNIALTIKGGTFAQAVACGDGVSAGVAVTRAGNLTTSISGGTFNGVVAGGMFYCPSSSSNQNTGTARVVGNLSLTITGGTFNNRIYGGNIARTDSLGVNTTVTGSVSLTIDATSAIAINENVVAGSMGKGAVTGSVTVTFKGEGSNLTFGDDSVIFGGSNSDYTQQKSDNKVETVSYVGPGNNQNSPEYRNLVFDGFSGNFGAEIRMFGTAEFKNSSSVVFTDEDINLWAVEDWEFTYGSSASGLEKNDFYDDTLNLDLTDYDGNQAWTVLSGTEDAFKNFDEFEKVTFNNGQAATYNSSNKCWSDGSYKLTLTGSGDDYSMVLTRV